VTRDIFSSSFEDFSFELPSITTETTNRFYGYVPSSNAVIVFDQIVFFGAVQA
jgi:hypothetical protein